jgi:hypothetical protein
MRHHPFVYLALVAIFAVVPRTTAADGISGCAVTEAPSPVFIPPVPFAPPVAPQAFWLGSSSLWTMVPSSPWHLGSDGRKLPYWREGFDSQKENEPRLNVVARRLDSPAPLIWAPLASGVKAHRVGAPDDMAMLTGLEIPTAGCWEISAHYGSTDSASRRWREHTLTYTVRVEQ